MLHLSWEEDRGLTCKVVDMMMTVDLMQCLGDSLLLLLLFEFMIDVVFNSEIIVRRHIMAVLVYLIVESVGSTASYCLSMPQVSLKSA